MYVAAPFHSSSLFCIMYAVTKLPCKESEHRCSIHNYIEMTDTTPLEPGLENTYPPNSPYSATQSKNLLSPKTPKTPSSPSGLIFSAGMAKISHSSVASSPFFSSPPGKQNRGDSPSKMSDFEFIGEDDLYGGEAGDETGNDTVCSTFSDVNIGQYGQDAAARGNSVKRSAANVHLPSSPPFCLNHSP